MNQDFTVLINNLEQQTYKINFDRNFNIRWDFKNIENDLSQIDNNEIIFPKVKMLINSANDAINRGNLSAAQWFLAKTIQTISDFINSRNTSSQELRNTFLIDENVIINKQNNIVDKPESTGNIINNAV